MKAVVKTRPEPGNVELMDVPEPTAGEDQVVIQVHSAGICGTDIHILRSEYVIHPPVVMGHEVCGEIVEMGTGVTGFAVGDRVTLNPTAARLCGTCRYCRAGAPFFCVDRAGLGSGVDGGFAKYCAARQGILFRVPEGLDSTVAALSEPLACIYQAVVELTEIKAGELVVVTGPGPIGLMALLLAKVRGARVLVLGTDADAVRLDCARSLGADAVLDVEQEDAAAVVADLTAGYGADVALECSGAAGGAAQCLELLKSQGSYTQVGIFGAPIQVDLDAVVIKQLRVQGSICHTWQTWERTMAFLASGAINLSPLISTRLPLTRWQEAFDGVIAKRSIKTLLYPDD